LIELLLVAGNGGEMMGLSGRPGQAQAHFGWAESQASASSNEKEYSWSATPERILAPSTGFTM
jgi:hypothetical protein